MTTRTAPPAETARPARRAARRTGAPARTIQGLTADQFFYFYLRIRKGEVRRVVQRVQALYPDETPAQWARRLIASQSTLSFFSGVLIHLPLLFPIASTIVRYAGLVGGASVLTQMHLYLILEIALLHGKDIDDRARVEEMLAVMAASGLAAATPMALRALNWAPAVAIPTSGLATATVTRLIGEAAITFYAQEPAPRLEAAPTDTVAAG
jgi:hypothetical protein